MFWRPPKAVEADAAFLLAVLAGLVLTTSNASAASFTMADGTVVEGDIIDNMAGNAIIRSSIGYAINSHMSDIDAVVFNLKDGSTISGTLIDWNDDIYIIRYEGKDAIVQIERTEERGYLLQSVTTGQAEPVPAALPSVTKQPVSPQPSVNLPSRQPTM